MLIIILGIILLVTGTGLAILSHPAFGLWRHHTLERIQASPNYYEGMFQNQEPTLQFTGDSNGPDDKHRRWKMIKHFMADKDSVRIPIELIEAVKTDLKVLPTDSDWIVWFGHSSYLFCLNGKRVLVNPLLQPEWPSSMMLKAFSRTDIYRPSDLPEIDMLIVTHEHWDHMDYATLRDIRTKVKYVVCPLGIADYLRYWAIRTSKSSNSIGMTLSTLSVAVFLLSTCMLLACLLAISLIVSWANAIRRFGLPL